MDLLSINRRLSTGLIMLQEEMSKLFILSTAHLMSMKKSTAHLISLKIQVP